MASLGRLLRAAAFCAPLLACASLAAQDRIGFAPLAPPAGALDADGRVGALAWAGGLTLSGIGGLSAFDAAPDGSILTMLSDRTWTATVAPLYDGTGTLVGLETLRTGQLLGADGAPYPGGFNDSEGLAMLPLGWRVVSFEGFHRLMIFDPGLVKEEGEIPLPRDEQFERNKGIEAISRTADGRLVIFSEADGPGDPLMHQAWIGGEDGWDAFALKVEPGYRPTDAALLPNGDILLLERHDPFLATVGGAVRRIPFGDIAPGAVVEGDLLARLDGAVFPDNYEAITAWQDGEGRVRILVGSDNNQIFLLRTVLLQFVWTP
jgi:hypothetical protein